MTSYPAHDPRHPAHRPTPPELEPGSGVLDATVAEGILAGYGLTLAQAVEVELLVSAPGGAGRLVEGTVLDANPAVLVLEAKAGRRTTRIPWQAVALIRDGITTHPATS